MGLSAVQDKLVLDGRSWTVAEVPQDESVNSGSATRGAGSGSRQNAGGGGIDRPDPPAVVTQHLQIERQFVIINSKVISTLKHTIVNDATARQPGFESYLGDRSVSVAGPCLLNSLPVALHALHLYSLRDF